LQISLKVNDELNIPARKTFSRLKENNFLVATINRDYYS